MNYVELAQDLEVIAQRTADPKTSRRILDGARAVRKLEFTCEIQARAIHNLTHKAGALDD